MSEFMHCSRCGKGFDKAELKSLSRFARVISFPYLLLMQSLKPLAESAGQYCKPCRRQINVCLLFLGFLVVLFGTMTLIQANR